MIFFGPEASNDFGALVQRHGTRDDKGLEPREALRHGRHSERVVDVLRKHQCLVALGRQFDQPTFNVVQLARLARLRIHIANLLKAGDERKDVMDPNLGTQRLQVDDALSLQPVIGSSLTMA